MAPDRDAGVTGLPGHGNPIAKAQWTCRPGNDELESHLPPLRPVGVGAARGLHYLLRDRNALFFWIDAMAGHSQFKNIMHRKGRQDAVRSKLFGKLAREITVSAKLGTPDPAMNPRLRAAVLAARAENMPKDNIERAIRKAAGGDTETYDEIRYEGYGPGGVAVIVEVLTDNRNRTASDVRASFTKSGGNLAETGAVSFMFDRVGVIEYDASVASADTMLEAAIDAGADDVVSSADGHQIYASQDTFREVARAVEAKFGEPRKAALVWKPQNTVPVDDEQGEKLLRLIETLEDHDDVQNVYANFEVSDALVQKMSA